MSSPTGRSATCRVARWAFVAHVTVIVFATTALVTIVAGPTPDVLQTGMTGVVYRLGWQLSGPTYVVLGAMAALAHAASSVGWRRAAALLVTASGISLAAELVGTMTGAPFGPYAYTSLLGYRVAGHVPFPIPLSWFFMIYCSLALCGRLLTTRSPLAWACVAGVLLTAWDVAMDPAMSFATKHWIWYTNGPYFGMPLSNWVGWFLTGSLIARTLLAIVPPEAFARAISPSRLPIALYAVNAVMPVALCMRHGLWPAGLIGALVMMVPVTMALVERTPAPQWAR
jgi:uncharacterized membrane protein